MAIIMPAISCSKHTIPLYFLAGKSCCDKHQDKIFAGDKSFLGKGEKEDISNNDHGSYPMWFTPPSHKIEVVRNIH